MGPFPSMGLPSASTTRPRRASPTGTSTWAGQYFGRGHGKNRTYNLSGTLDGLAFLDQSVRTEKHHTNLAGFQVHAHALDTRGEPAIPLVSVVACWSMWLRVLDKLLGLDVAHAVNTGNTVTVPLSTSVPLNMRWRCGLPDGKHTSSLGETVLLLDATDPLLEDRGHLGRGGLCFGGIGSDGVGEGRGAGLVWWGTWSVRGRRLGRGELPPPSAQRRSLHPSPIERVPLRRQWYPEATPGANGDGEAGCRRTCRRMRWTYRRNSARGRDCSDPAARLADGSREHCCGAQKTVLMALQPIEIDAGKEEGSW